MTTSLVIVVRDLARERGVELTPVSLELVAGIAGLIARGQVDSEPKQPGHPAADQWALASRAVAHAQKIGISIGEVKRCLREDFKP